jgi:hypothetical protein
MNAAGRCISFCAPARAERSAKRYERRVAETGAVEHREENWHDLFNALVWLTFPRAKAVLNSRHVSELAAHESGRRSATRDALTQFDEEGMVIVSAQGKLIDLLRAFRWRELFWDRRSEVQRSMRYYIFGHAHYEKALRPFVGMTAKAISFEVATDFCVQPYRAQLEAIDSMTARHLSRADALPSPRALAPVPTLGIPGWSAQSTAASFYDDRTYFRLNRRYAAL